MHTYTNRQAQEILSLVKNDKAVTRKALFQAIMYTLGNTYIRCPGERPRRVDEVYHKLIEMRFTYRRDTHELLIRLIKREDWSSICTILSWAVSTRYSPFNN